MSTKKNRTTYNQLATMVDFLEQNKELLLNKNWKKNPEKWTELSNILNGMKNGPLKSCKEWKRVLIEWKYNTKRKLRNIGDSKRLNNAEEKLIKLLINEPYENLESNELPFIQIFETGTNNAENIIIENESLEANMKTDKQNKPETDIKTCGNNLNYNKIKKCSPSKNRKSIKYSSVWSNINKKLDENTKSQYYLAKAINKLADSTYKNAESNYKIAESNNSLAEAIQLYNTL